MAKYAIDSTTLYDVADAIREKTGNFDRLSPSAYASEIRSITAGGGGTPWFYDEADDVWYDNSDGSWSPDYDNMPCPYCGARLQSYMVIDGNPIDTDCPVCRGAITLLDGNALERQGGGDDDDDSYPYYYDVLDGCWFMNDDIITNPDYDNMPCPYCGTRLQSSNEIDGNPQDTNCPHCDGTITLVDGQAHKRESGISLYQRVDYIISAEEETYPYIITDFYGDNTCGLEIIASFPKMHDRIPMGSRENSDATRFYCVYPLSTSSIYYGFNSGVTISCSLKVNTIYRCQTNFLNSRLVNVYNESGTRMGGGSISATMTKQSAPVSIFGYNSASSGNVSSKREYKLYSARCSKGHEVVREYIPCYRKRDLVVGLYEKFTGQFLTSETGAFTYGTEIDW